MFLGRGVSGRRVPLSNQTASRSPHTSRVASRRQARVRVREPDDSWSEGQARHAPALVRMCVSMVGSRGNRRAVIPLGLVFSARRTVRLAAAACGPPMQPADLRSARGL